jgi:dimethylargininase
MLALTHLPSPNMQQCQRTYIAHDSIDYNHALLQHENYCQTLRNLGAKVQTLGVNLPLPDCVFIEDTVIVLDELAILCSMGTESRRLEPPGIEAELRKYRHVEEITLPATIEGGDVLRVGRQLLVGISSRTNRVGISALRSIVQPHGYTVTPIPVHGCLHLKTACTALDESRLLINPNWIDATPLCNFELQPIPPTEPFAANILPLAGRICIAAGHVKTADLLDKLGFDIQPIDLSEFAKAEGGLTCLSILLNTNVAEPAD